MRKFFVLSVNIELGIGGDTALLCYDSKLFMF